MRQAQPRPGLDKSAGWCSQPKGEDDQTFRVKLRTDMIQVVRDQHDMLQSWACQWERKSMAQMDDLAKVLNELRDDVKTLKETSATRKEKKSNYLSTRVADLEKYGSILMSSSSGGPVGEGERSLEEKDAQRPQGRASAASHMVEALEVDTLEITGKDLMEESAGDAAGKGRNSGIASNINRAAQMVQEDPATYFWEKLSEQFPVLKTNPCCVSISRLARYMGSDEAKEPERTGSLAQFEASPMFEAICMTVILFNTWTLFLTANEGMRTLEDNEAGWIKILNSCFTVFYMIELAIKLTVHRFFFFISEQRVWNMFDICLVAGGSFELFVGLMENGNESMLNPAFVRCMRLFKLAKILRVVRVMRFFRELRLMLKCVVGSFASLFWAFVMLFCFNLLFAIFFVQQLTNYLIDHRDDRDTKEKAELYFGSVQTAMLSLFKGISGGNDWDTYFPVIEESGWMNASVFIFYILLVWISLTNIITSIFVEKALEFAQPSQDEIIIERHARDRETATELKVLFMKNDKDQSCSISHDEFMDCLRDETLTDYMMFRGIEIKDAQAFFRMLASVSKEGEVDIKTIIGGLISLKGNASNIDMLSLSSWLSTIHHLQEDMIGEMATQRRLIVALMQHQQELQDQE